MKKTVHPITRRLTGEIGAAAEHFLYGLKKLRRNPSTINDHLLYLHRFNQYLNDEGIKLLGDIGEHHILSFLSTRTNNKINVVSSLRMFFRYAYEERLLKTDLSYVLANYKWEKREKLPSFYTAKEVIKIESTVSRSSEVGKRNYAVLLLATRLGLRASDIANLSFVNFDWDKSRITLQQYKTGKKIRKKDLGLMATTYGYVYVAQVAMGANQTQYFKALKEAEAYPGPSLIIAYSPCINHGLKAGMGASQEESKKAVECGYWHLYRYNPQLEAEGKNPFIYDSKEPQWDMFQKFLMGEVRYTALLKAFPAEAKELFKAAEENAKWRYNTYKRLANVDYEVVY